MNKKKIDYQDLICDFIFCLDQGSFFDLVKNNFYPVKRFWNRLSYFIIDLSAWAYNKHRIVFVTLFYESQ